MSHSPDDESDHGPDGEDEHDPNGGCECGDASDGPPDPALDPAASPGVGGVEDHEDVEVDRDVDIGEATPRELTVGDTKPVAGAEDATLRRTLRDGDAVERGRAAIELAGRDPSGPALAALADRARSDDDPDVRQFAVEAIGESETLAASGDAEGGPAAEALAAVRDALDDPDPWVRAEAVVALDHLEPTDAAEAVEAALDDEHHAVRRNALVSLFKHRGEEALSDLLAAADDESERVREWVAHLLGGVDDDRARGALADLADDESDVVAKTADAALRADPETFRDRFGVETARGGTDSYSAGVTGQRDEPPDL